MKEIERLVSSIEKKEKLVAMLAPCFVAQFDYPEIIGQLKRLGFDKVVELTFGAKIVNRKYHEILEKNKGLWISSVCPGVVETIKKRMPQYEKNILKVYSPMIVTAKVCKKVYPKHKIAFISPCEFKKTEAKITKDVDIAIGMTELQELFDKYNILPKKSKKDESFDMFYNDYTKIYPIAGGLSKTLHTKGILKPEETKKIDGMAEILKFLKNPDKRVRFLDVTFCIGGCIGGPLLTREISLEEKKKRVIEYVKQSLHKSIPKGKLGKFKEAKGIKITY